MRKRAAVVAAVLVLTACGKNDDARFGQEAPLGTEAVPTPHLRLAREGEPSPASLTLELVVEAQHCIEDDQAVVEDVAVAETSDAVTVTARLGAGLRSIAACTKGVALYAPVPMVTLKAPLGNRRILDGSCSPPAQVLRQFENRTFCEPTADEKAQEDSVGEWAPFAAGPLSPRGEPKAAWTGTELVIVGGLALEQYRSLSDGAAYNPATKTWRRIADLPVPGRVHAVSATSGGILALSHPGTDYSVFKGTNAHVYDVASDSWRAVPPPTAFTYPRAFWTGTENVVWGAEGGAVLNPSTGAWRAIPPVSVAGATTSGLASGGVAQWIAEASALAVEGDYDARDGSPVRSALFLFSPATNRWRKASDPPRSLGHGGSFVVGAFEVFDSLDQGGAKPLAYDAKRDTWRELDALDGDRDGGTAYFTGHDIGDGRGVVRVGSSAKPLLMLDLASGNWAHAASPGRLPAPDAVMAWTGQALLLWGRPTPIRPDDRNAAWIWTPPAKTAR